MTSNVGRLRLIGFLEGVSLLVLIGIAVPIKYLYGNPALVKSVGPVYGILFILFIFNALSVSLEQHWKFRTIT